MVEKATLPLEIIESKNVGASCVLSVALKAVPLFEKVITRWKDGVYDITDDEGNVIFTVDYPINQMLKGAAFGAMAEMSSDYLEDFTQEKIVFTNTPEGMKPIVVGKLERVETPVQKHVAHTLFEKYRK